jgi:hypothetical protein
LKSKRAANAMAVETKDSRPSRITSYREFAEYRERLEMPKQIDLRQESRSRSRDSRGSKRSLPMQELTTSRLHRGWHSGCSLLKLSIPEFEYTKSDKTAKSAKSDRADRSDKSSR